MHRAFAYPSLRRDVILQLSRHPLARSAFLNLRPRPSNAPPLVSPLNLLRTRSHSHGAASGHLSPKQSSTEAKHDDHGSSIWTSLKSAFGGGHGHSHGGGLGHSHGGGTGGSQELQGAARRITLLGGLLNLALAAAKFVLGLLIKSNALVADAVHSLSDMISDVVTIFALRLSSRARTTAFPYGFGKVENLSAVVVSVLLVLAGGGMIWQSLGALLVSLNLIDPEKAEYFGGGHHHGAPDTSEAGSGHDGPSAATLTRIAVALALVSVVVKEMLYVYTKQLGKKMNSPAILANASHHRSDSLSAMVTLVGVGGNWVGIPWLDPVAGAVVSGMIIHMGATIAWDNTKQLLDASAPTETLDELRQFLAQEIGIHPTSSAEGGPDPLLSRFRYHSLRARSSGQFTAVDLILSAFDSQHPPTVAEAAQVRALIRQKLVTSFSQIKEVIVQFDDHTLHSNGPPPCNTTHQQGYRLVRNLSHAWSPNYPQNDETPSPAVTNEHPRTHNESSATVPPSPRSPTPFEKAGFRTIRQEGAVKTSPLPNARDASTISDRDSDHGHSHGHGGHHNHGH